jgi:16S rRNA (cytosine967-C5)-methyltransferase
MMETPMQGNAPIRQLALQVLCQVESSGAFADRLITGMVSARRLSPQERAFLRELAYGVLRWRNRLDWQLERCSTRTLGSLDSTVRNLLRLGAYQLAYMQRIPAFAAVSETVQLAKRVGHPGVVAYVNAVLRSLQRQLGNTALPKAEDGLATHLVVTQSHPSWLVERWLEQHGAEQTVAMCQANNLPPPLVVRVNPLQTTPERLLASLRGDGCDAMPCRYAPNGICLTSHPPLERLHAYQDGWFTVQDEAAILCGYLIGAEPGERVLDTCAAPGGKATHAAERMHDEGEVLCLDNNWRRLKLVAENARRLKLKSLRCLVGNAERVAFTRPFDRVVVDAPCSGLGVLRRHPDAKWRKDPALIDVMARQQMAILGQVRQFVGRNGVLVYLTCSTEMAENQHVIRAFLEQHSEFSLESIADDLPASARDFVRGDWFQTMPGVEGLDGFFGARMRRGA